MCVSSIPKSPPTTQSPSSQASGISAFPWVAPVVGLCLLLLIDYLTFGGFGVCSVQMFCREQGTLLSQGNSKVVESVSFSRWHSLYPQRPALIKDDYRWWKEIPWLERALGWAWGASDGTVQHGQWQLRWWSHQTTSFSLWFFKDVSLRPLGECRDLNLKGNLAFKTFNAQVLCSPPAKSCSLPGCHPARKSRMSVLLFPCQWQMSLKKREIKLIRGEAVSQFLGLNLQELTPRVWEVELLCGFSWFLWGWPMDNAGGMNRLFVNNEEKTCGVMI